MAPRSSRRREDRAVREGVRDELLEALRRELTSGSRPACIAETSAAQPAFLYTNVLRYLFLSSQMIPKLLV